MEATASFPHPTEPPGDGVALVVGLGASAGGIEALKAFFSGLPASAEIAFVVLLHLDRAAESRLADVLQRTTPMPVEQVAETAALLGGRVYVVPPDRRLAVRDGHLVLEPLPDEAHARIDHFFRMLAEAYGPRAAGVVLSGTGADGSAGIGRIREQNGLVLAQHPDDAVFDEMPRHAIAADTVDAALPAADLGGEIVAYLRHLRRERRADEPLADDRGAALRGILADLHDQTGHEFAHYKRGTVLRRVDRRMYLRGAPTLDAYRSLLAADADEAEALLADLLISVTHFFRDPPAWDALEREALPALFARDPAEVRVWVAGCATGEEAYTVAMLLLERAARLDEPPAIQVFATDLSEAAVRTAREGVYPASIEADVSPERLRRFFAAESGRYRLREHVREHVVFAPHNLLAHPPFSRIGLVCCRNVLIYFQRDLQRRALERFHFALVPGGTLMLGTSEAAESAPKLFGTLDKDAHLFSRHNAETPSFPASRPLRLGRPAARADAAAPPVANAPEDVAALHAALQASAAPPSVLVSERGEVVHVSPAAAALLTLPAGAPAQTVADLVPPGLRHDVRVALLRVREEAAPVRLPPSELEPPDGTERPDARRVAVHARPAGRGGLVQLLFVDAPPLPSLADVETEDAAAVAAAAAAALLHTLRDELHLAREMLQFTVEQSETGQEEMMSQNEELQSMNEELRSTAEELETSRESAQSMSEELRALNIELRGKVEQASRATGDLENLIVSTEIAVLFLDRELRIQRFTPRVREHVHVLSSDLGRPLADLARKHGHAHLLEDAEAVLETLQVREREVEADGDRWFLVHIRPYRAAEGRVEGVVVTFVDVTDRKRGQRALAESEARYRTVLTSIDDGFALIDVVVDGDGRAVDYRFAETNPAVERHAGLSGVAGRLASEILPDLDPVWFERYGRVAATGEPERFAEDIAALGRRLDIYAVRVGAPEDRRVGVVFRDVTEVTQTAAALAASERRYRTLFTTIDEGFFLCEAIRDAQGRVADYRYLEVNPAFEALTGLSAEAVVGRTVREAIPGVEDLWIDRVGEVADTGLPIRYEDYAAPLDRWVAAHAYPQGGDCVAVLFDNVTDRKRAEIALRESEARYRTLFETIDEGFALCEMITDETGGPVDFRFVEVNPAFFDRTGFPPDAAGRTARDLVPGVETHWVEQYARVGLGRETLRFTESAASVGRVFDVFAAPTEPHGRFTIVFNDVTVRVEAEALLQAEARRAGYRTALVDALRPLADPAAVEAVAARVLGEHLAATRVHYAEVELDGVHAVVSHDYTDGAASVRGRHHLDRFGAAFAEGHRTGRVLVIPEIAAEPTLGDAERAAYAAFGVAALVGVPLVKAGRLAALLVVHQSTPRAWTPDDVALVEETAERTWVAIERARAEAALAASEERFRRTAETVLDILFTADAKGRVDYVNARFEEVTGQPRASALGTAMWPDLLHPDDCAHATWTDTASGTDEVTIRHRLRMADGGYRWFLTRARAFCTGDVEAGRWYGTCTDIDALVEAEAAVRALNETLEARVAERTQQVDALSAHLVEAETRERKRLALVLHDDLQQQLFGLSMILALARSAGAEAERAAFLTRADDVLASATALTRSLANDLDPPVLDSERLADLLGWLAERTRDQYGLELAVDVAEPCVVPERAQRALLFHALGEVLFNVVKHARVDRAALRARVEAGEVRVTVEDAGVGFDPGAVSGVRGLGLASVRERLELAGGRLVMDSAPGAGTRTTLAVPLAPEPDATGERGENPETGPAEEDRSAP